MKLKLKILMAAFAVMSLTSGTVFANSFDVSYIVTGNPGNYILTFNVDESDDSGQIVIFGVNMGTAVAAPQSWVVETNAAYSARWVYAPPPSTPFGDVYGFEVSFAGQVIPAEIIYVVQVINPETLNAAVLRSIKYTGIATAAVPEPATLFLLGLGLLGAAGLRRILKN